MALALGQPDELVDQVGDDERFRIRSALEIAGLLRSVAAHREIVTVQFGEGDDFVVSAVLAVDVEQALVVLDYGADEPAMQRLLRATRLRISTQLDSVRILFKADAAAAATFDGGMAFCVRLPHAVIRMQRRDAYRLKLPLGRPLTCDVALPDPHGERIGVRVRDISVAGVGLVDLPKTLPAAAGTLWQACTIELPGLGTLTADIEVMHATTSGEARRCGCRFRALPLPMANLIQRYITRVEREQHAVR